MNGIHDMGGMDGFGAVSRVSDEAPFHSEWERRIFGLALAAHVAANTDEFRHALERVPASRYLNSSYYERWLDGVEILLVEKGRVSREEMAARGAEPPTPSQPPQHMAEGAAKAPRKRARFQAGDAVVARNINPSGHTRLPRYVRGKHGVIWRDWGLQVFPDSHAHGGGERQQHVYSVVFKARELWGDGASSRDRVHVDLWEDYLQPASAPKNPARRKPAAARGKRRAGRKRK